MWSFLFHWGKIRSTRKAEAERQCFQEADHFYEHVQHAGKPARYKDLSLLVNRSEFKEKVRIMRRFTWRSRKAGERWKDSEECHALAEYRRLKKDKELERYFRLQNDKPFHEYKSWEIAFEDHFSGLYLDAAKWITRYYAGELFLNDSYAVGNDVQLFKPGNIMLREGRLVLQFRRESVEGKYWDKNRGIVAGKYSYTSGLISTALSFRQAQGRFEAKIHVDNSPVSFCFWLTGDTVYPHVNVMKLNRGYYQAGCFLKHGDEKACEKSPVRLKQGCYIFTLDWTADELIWKINDCIMRREKNNLPDIPLYAVFNLGSVEDIPDKHLPVNMHLEWIRFFRKIK